MIADLKNMDAMDMLASLPAGSVDAIITDPPFGTTHAAWDKAPDWPAFFRACWRALKKRRTAGVQSEPGCRADYLPAAAVVSIRVGVGKTERRGRAERKQNAAAGA